MHSIQVLFCDIIERGLFNGSFCAASNGFDFFQKEVFSAFEDSNS